jgi:hypothetical protein
MESMGGILKIFRQNSGSDPNLVQANSTLIDLMKKEHEEWRQRREMRMEGEISYYFNYTYKKIYNDMKKKIRKGHKTGLIRIYLHNSVEEKEYIGSKLQNKIKIASAIKPMLENQGLKVEIKTDWEPIISVYGVSYSGRDSLWLEVKWSII